MKTVSRYFYFSLAVTTLSAVAVLWRAALPPVAVLPLVLGVVWGLPVARRWRWFGSLAFVLFALLFGLGAWLTGGAFLLWPGVLALLATWDVDRWMDFAGRAQTLADEALLIRLHARRLGGVLLGGFVLGLVGISLQIRLPFGVAALLGLSLILAVRQLVHASRRI